MKPRLAFLPLAALLCGAALAAPQNAPPTGQEQALHLSAVRAERSARFFEAFVTADAVEREAAQAFLGKAQRARDPLGRRPSLVELATATELLGGADQDSAGSELARFAQGLDLQVVPGAFIAESTAGLGTPLTVTVYRLEGDPPARDVEIALDWQAPDGTRTRARTEPFGAQAFRAPGFHMFVRSPVSEPGLWRLVPVVRAGGREFQGAGVPVECVADLLARTGRSLSAEPAGVDVVTARQRLDRLLRAGLRSPEACGATPCLLPLEDPAAPAWRPTGDSAGGPLLYGGFADERRVGALVLLLFEGEAEEIPLTGPVGDAWRALARERGLGLFVLSTKGGDTAGLRRGLAEVARLAGADPILVARGRALLTASLLFAAAAPEGPLPLAGLVAQSPAPGIPKLRPPVPALVVAPGAPPSEVPSDVTFRQGGDVSLLDELRLPALVGEWLGR